MPVVLLHGMWLPGRYLVPLGRRLVALGHRQQTEHLRWAVAVQGLVEVLRSSMTRVWAGRVRLVPIPPTSD